MLIDESAPRGVAVTQVSAGGSDDIHRVLLTPVLRVATESEGRGVVFRDFLRSAVPNVQKGICIIHNLAATVYFVPRRASKC